MMVIRAVSKQYARQYAFRIEEQPEIAVISILDTGKSAIFSENPKHLTLCFDDIQPAVGMHFLNLTYFNKNHAKDIVEFLEEVKHGNFEMLLIHCTAGISRSGAVAKLARKMLDVPSDKFHKENRFIYPNKYILRKLYETWKEKTKQASRRSLTRAV